MTVQLATAYANLESEFKSPIPQASETDRQEDGVHMQDGVVMQDDGVPMQDDGVVMQDDGDDMNRHIKWRRPPDRVWWP